MNLTELRDHLADVRRELDRDDLSGPERKTLETESDETRRAMLLALDDGSPGRYEYGDGDRAQEHESRGDRDRALRVIERHADITTAAAADRLDRLVRRADPQALASRYLAAVADDHYLSAFGKLLVSPVDAHLRWTPEEHAAFQRVGRVLAEQRALSLTVAEGGYAVPYTLDPTVIALSDGSVNPLRQIARVEIGIAETWKGVASAGITADYALEGAEAGDDAPDDFVQPAVTAHRAHVFVPFSIELESNWPAMQRELARMIADAKDASEAVQFVTGTGLTVYPQGVVTGVAAYGTADSVIETDAASTLANGDLYALKQALAARFAPKARWLLHGNIADAVYRLGSPVGDEPPVMPTREGPILGRPVNEASGMADEIADAALVALLGDFSRFLIYDRVGMTIELIPHLLGANRRPTGQRGIYAYWRNSAIVLDGNAFRLLKVKAAS